jgi:hypothetical protein
VPQGRGAQERKELEELDSNKFAVFRRDAEFASLDVCRALVAELKPTCMHCGTVLLPEDVDSCDHPDGWLVEALGPHLGGALSGCCP